MNRPKKPYLTGRRTVAPGVHRHTVGKGFTERSTHQFDEGVASSEDVLKHIVFGERPPEDVGLGHYYGEPFDRIRREAENILKDAGPLTKPMRARKSKEWYATEIIKSIDVARAAISQRNALQAASHSYILGILHTEARVSNFFKKEGGKGGPKERRNIPIVELADYITRKKTEETPKDIWNRIPEDEVLAIKIGGFKYYREKGKLYAIEKIGKEWRPAWKPIQYDSFRNYIYKAKKKEKNKAKKPPIR